MRELFGRKIEKYVNMREVRKGWCQMELNYNVKGDSRKQLVRALEEILGAKSEYMGVPTFAYRIGRVMVDREGTVIEEGASIVAFQNVAIALS